LGREAGRGLVEEQQARRRSERDRQLELSLLAMRDLARWRLNLGGKPDVGQRRARTSRHLGIAVPAPPQQASPGRTAGEGGDPNVLEQRKRREDVGALKRAGKAEVSDAVRACPGDIAPVEEDAA